MIKVMIKNELNSSSIRTFTYMVSWSRIMFSLELMDYIRGNHSTLEGKKERPKYKKKSGGPQQGMNYTVCSEGRLKY